jgi:hypothetical protein
MRPIDSQRRAAPNHAPRRGTFKGAEAALPASTGLPSATGQTGYRLERGDRQALGTTREDQWQFPVQPLARLFPAELEQLVEELG